MYKHVYQIYKHRSTSMHGSLKILLKLFQAGSSPDCSQSFSSLMPNPADMLPACQEEKNSKTAANFIIYMECSWLSASTAFRVSIAAASCL